MELTPQVTAQSWLILCLLGATLGVVGQMIRVVAGLKKASDEAAAENRSLKDDFDSGRLVRSLMIGGVAGVVAVLSSLDPTKEYAVKALLTIVAAGYAGADFIEAFVTTSMPQAAKTGGSTQTGTNAGTQTGTNTTAGKAEGGSGSVGPAGGPQPESKQGQGEASGQATGAAMSTGASSPVPAGFMG